MTSLLRSFIRIRAAVALALALGACRSGAPHPSPEAVARTRTGALFERQAPPGATAQFFAPNGMAAVNDSLPIINSTENNQYLVVADTLNNTIRRIELPSGLTTTVAGTPGVEGSTGPLFRKPTGIAAISQSPGVAGGIFVADTGNHTIRGITVLNQLAGETTVTTLAGVAGQRGYQNADGGLFDSPQGVAAIWTSAGWKVFVADTGNGVIRTFVAEDEVIPTIELIAGTPGQQGFADAAVGTQAKFNHPTGLVVRGTKLYVADTGNHAIRVIDISAGGTASVATFAGMPGSYGHRDGSADQALFAQPVGIALGHEMASGAFVDRLLVTDRASYTVRKVSFPTPPATPVVTTLAGIPWERGALDGDVTAARFRAPSGIGYDWISDRIYVADTGNNLVRAVRATGSAVSVSTFTGTRSAGAGDGWPTAFVLGQPTTLACDGDRLFSDGNGVHVIDLDPGRTSGAARTVGSTNWSGFVHLNNGLYRMSDYGIERLDIQTGERTEYCSVGLCNNDSNVSIVATDTGVYNKYSSSQDNLEHMFGGTLPDNFMFHAPTWDGTYVYSQSPTGLVKSNATSSPVEMPVDFGGQNDVVAMAAHGGFVYFTASHGAGDPYRHTIRRVALATGAISVFLGSPGAVDAPFENPSGLCVSGDDLFVADTANGQIRKVALATGEVTSLALRRAQ